MKVQGELRRDRPMPVRILFISHSASRTGAPILLLEIAKRLDSARYQPLFLLPEEGPLTDQFRSAGETFIAPLYPEGVKYWREVKQCTRRIAFLRSVRPDLVYCNTIHSAKWLPYAWLLRIPAVTHVHELSMGFAVLGPLEYFFIARYSARLIAVSGAVETYLAADRGIKSSRIDTVRAGIDPHSFGTGDRQDYLRSNLGTRGHFVVGTVGRITAMKGSDLFLRVAALVRRQTAAPVKFLVVASVADREFYRAFQNLIDELHLREHILLVEEARHVAPYYALMDVYVSTAREDPFPLVILEAMASRIPVVAFSAGGIPEAVTSECAILVDDQNIEVMSAEILALMNNPSRRNGMGTAGRRRVETEFDISVYTGKIQRVIDSVLSKRFA